MTVSVAFLVLAIASQSHLEKEMRIFAAHVRTLYARFLALPEESFFCVNAYAARRTAS